MSATLTSRGTAAVTGHTPAPSIRYRNGALCALLVAACMWAAWPVSKMGFLDDWSYARTAQVFAATGHVAYTGFAEMMLGWQILWGALFIKLFGFSFVILRVSMLPIAMATVFLFHEILLRFGVNTRNAVIGTLTLGLSPLFLPLADSFMTDIPSVFIILVCVYCCQRAIAAQNAHAATLWLVLAACSNIAGGTVRQIAWLGVLVCVPSTGFLLRRTRAVLPVSLMLWGIGVLSILLCIKWFARQPFSISALAVSGLLPKRWALILIPLELGGSLLCSLLVLFPIVMPWLRTARRLSAAILRRAALVLVVCEAVQFACRFFFPWLGTILVLEFSRNRSARVGIPSPQQFLLPLWARAVSGAVIVAIALLLVIDLRASIRAGASTIRKLLARQEVAILGPYLVAYIVLLLPRAAVGVLFDRYLLGILPVLIVWLLLLHQHRIDEHLPRASVIWLCLFALLGIAGTHDWFAWYRARGAAVEEVLASGVPDTEIQAGYERDGWIQVQHGPINNRLITANYKKVPGLDRIPDDCRFDFADRTPSIHAKYSVGFEEEWCFAVTGYPPVQYTRWLPPFHEIVTVQRPIER